MTPYVVATSNISYRPASYSTRPGPAWPLLDTVTPPGPADTACTMH